MQDITKLTKPNVIEVLDYEVILAHMKEELVRRDPSFSALVESDPAIKILEIAAWRELLLRQRINNAAQANLLAFAQNADLEHLAAFYDVHRKTGEDDHGLRQRTQAKIVGWSTAGSREHYRYHALAADIRIKDARVDSPMLGLIQVAILSTEGNGEPSAELLAKAQAAILNDDVRVLTDTVEVISAGIITTNIQAEIYLYPETAESIITTSKAQFMASFNKSKRLGWDLTRSWIIAHLFAPGIQCIELSSPAADIAVQDNECIALENIKLEIAGRQW